MKYPIKGCMKDKQLDLLCKDYLDSFNTTEYIEDFEVTDNSPIIIRSAISNGAATRVLNGECSPEDCLKYMVKNLISSMKTKGGSETYTFKRKEGYYFREITSDPDKPNDADNIKPVDSTKKETVYELRLIGWLDNTGDKNAAYN